VVVPVRGGAGGAWPLRLAVCLPGRRGRVLPVACAAHGALARVGLDTRARVGPGARGVRLLSLGGLLCLAVTPARGATTQLRVVGDLGELARQLGDAHTVALAGAASPPARPRGRPTSAPALP